MHFFVSYQLLLNWHILAPGQMRRCRGTQIALLLFSFMMFFRVLGTAPWCLHCSLEWNSTWRIFVYLSELAFEFCYRLVYELCWRLSLSRRHQPALKRFSHDAIMSWCHDVMMSWCHDVMITWQRHHSLKLFLRLCMKFQGILQLIH